MDSILNQGNYNQKVQTKIKLYMGKSIKDKHNHTNIESIFFTKWKPLQQGNKYTLRAKPQEVNPLCCCGIDYTHTKPHVHVDRHQTWALCSR